MIVPAISKRLMVMGMQVWLQTVHLRWVGWSYLQPGICLEGPTLAGSALSVGSLRMERAAVAALQALRPLAPQCLAAVRVSPPAGLSPGGSVPPGVPPQSHVVSVLCIVNL